MRNHKTTKHLIVVVRIIYIKICNTYRQILHGNNEEGRRDRITLSQSMQKFKERTTFTSYNNKKGTFNALFNKFNQSKMR